MGSGASSPKRNFLKPVCLPAKSVDELKDVRYCILVLAGGDGYITSSSCILMPVGCWIHDIRIRDIIRKTLESVRLSFILN